MLCMMPAVGCNAQKDKNATSYTETQAIPTFEITLKDGSVFNTENIPTGQPVVMIFFSTDCSKCRMFVRELQANFAPLKDTRIYMATPMAMDGALIFAHDVGLDFFKNITWGVDAKNFVKPFYDISNLPAVVLYDHDKQFVQRFHGEFTANDVLQAVTALK